MLSLLPRIIVMLALLMSVGKVSATELTLQPRIKISAPHVILPEHVQIWVENHNVIKVGIWGPSQPPIGEGMARGVYQGIAADYLSVIQDSLNIKLDLVYFDDSDDALAALANHQIQMLATWNSARWPAVNAIATSPWLLDDAVLFTRKSGVKSAEFTPGSMGFIAKELIKPLHHHFPAASLHSFPQFDVAINAVELGQIDAVWLNRTTANYLQRYLQLNDVNLVESDLLSNLNLSFGIDATLSPLREAIDLTLNQLTLENRMRIASGWGLERRGVVTDNPLGLTPQEEEWFKRKKTIDVLINDQVPPIGFVNEQGKAQGFVVDLLDEISQRYDLTFTLHSFGISHDLATLEQRYPDALLINHWQREILSSTSPSPVSLLTSPMVVVMSKQTRQPASFDLLKGEALALSANNPLTTWLDTWYPTIDLIKTETPQQGLMLLNEQKVRGVIMPLIVANYLTSHESEVSFQSGMTVPAPSVNLVMDAVKPNNLGLEIVRKAINDMAPAKLLALAAPWYKASDSNRLLATPQLINSLAMAAMIITLCVLSGIWIYRLSRKLRRGEQSQAELFDQLRFTHTLIENIPIAIYARDRAGKLLHSNPSWSQTIGHPREALIGTAISDIDTMELSARHHLEQQYQKVLQNGESIYWADNFNFNGQTRFLSGWTVPWYDRDNQIGGLIGGWLDLTEKQALIESLQQAKTDLEQARASKAAFMQTMGHEIRTPLNAIIGLLEIELHTPAAKNSENLPLIWEAACNLLSLFGDVFDIFRAHSPLQSGTVRSVNLPQLVHSTVALSQFQAAEKGIEIKVEIDMKVERYELDTLQLIRIFSSLLRNAIKHSSGDVVTVALFQGRQDADEQLIPLVIEVSNQGECHFAEREEDDAPLTWTETGFNLHTCQQLAEHAGAEIAIESDDDEGTIISYYFRAAPAEQLAALPAAAQERQLHILVADDYVPGRRALRQLLSGWGHHVLEAENGEQAWQLLEQHPEVDLLITDCTMPIMDGFTLAQRQREYEAAHTSHPLPMFGLTALTGDEAEARCRASGMDECLSKPLATRALQQMLQRYFPAVSTPKTFEQAAQSPELRAELLEVNQQDAAVMQQWLSEKNRLETGRMAHRMCGSAHLLQDEPLLNACTQLEQACETACAWEEIINLAHALLSELERVNRNLSD